MQFVAYPRPRTLPIVDDEKRLLGLFDWQFTLSFGFILNEFAILANPWVDAMHYSRNIVTMPIILAAGFFIRCIPAILKKGRGSQPTFVSVVLAFLLESQAYAWDFAIKSPLVAAAVGAVVTLVGYFTLSMIVHAELTRYGLTLRGFPWQRRRNLKADLYARLIQAQQANSPADLAEIG